ncbi:MAG: apolipoprotein N-acyltransferase, partial [Caulobacteraceae bacterium]|nr:apolipoprotein N-acyltransferase [Caulobacteraceae bacterium]
MTPASAGPPRAPQSRRRGAHAAALSAVSALAAGVLAAVAFPPFGVLPGLLGYGLLMRLWDKAAAHRPLRSAFWRGWLAGFAFFLIATWWVYEAFQVDARNQGWMAPIAVALLAGGMGLFWGAAGLFYRWVAPAGARRVAVFAGAFCLLEWLRGHVLTGFPWDLAGETWRAGSPPSQGAALVGAYGLSWITVAAAAALTLAVEARRSLPARAGAGLGLAAVVGLYAYGFARLAEPDPASAEAPIVRVVQADEPERASYSEADLRDILARYLALSAEQGPRTPTVIIWPEGAIPDSADDYLAPAAWTRAAIEAALKPGQSLLVGAYRVQAGAPPLYFNTLIALREGPDGLVRTGRYDKHHLVPFGEYMPLDSLMGRLGVKKLVHVGDGFSAGPPPSPMQVQGLPPLQPLICYESLFPGLARDGGARRGPSRAVWIVNVSDDAWFGRTYGPLQHLNQAAYRAIEE